MSNHNRRAKKIDSNQPQIVEELLKLGFSVEPDYDDLIIGRNGVTLWAEVKTVDCYSKKTGLLLESNKTDSQKKLDETFSGARIYINCTDDVLRWFGMI